MLTFQTRRSDLLVATHTFTYQSMTLWIRHTFCGKTDQSSDTFRISLEIDIPGNLSSSYHVFESIQRWIKHNVFPGTFTVITIGIKEPTHWLQKHHTEVCFVMLNNFHFPFRSSITHYSLLKHCPPTFSNPPWQWHATPTRLEFLGQAGKWNTTNLRMRK